MIEANSILNAGYASPYRSQPSIYIFCRVCLWIELSPVVPANAFLTRVNTSVW